MVALSLDALLCLSALCTQISVKARAFGETSTIGTADYLNGWHLNRLHFKVLAYLKIHIDKVEKKLTTVLNQTLKRNACTSLVTNRESQLNHLAKVS